MSLINMNVVSELKNRTEFICIGFDYTNKKHKEFIDRITEEAFVLGCWKTTAGEIEEH